MKYRKITTTIIVVGLLCLGYYFVRAATIISIDESKLYPVSYVNDGDTFKARVDSHEITIRMLGINTPETVDPRKPVECYGKEASDETKGLLSGRQVRLKLNPNREEKDKYGRYLAYVYRDDDLFVNESLLQNGFAREYTYSRSTPYMFQKEFRDIEKTAKEKGRGLWESCEVKNQRPTQ